MKVVKGNLLDLALKGEFDVIIHGCNCLNTMGAGIAKQIKNRFPEAYNADCKTKRYDKSKLGKFSAALVERREVEFVIVNAYTQYYPEPWSKKVLVDYPAVRSVFQLIKESFTGKKIGYPKIGAGLARGDWNVISTIIDKELFGEDHTLVLYSSQKKEP